MQKPPSTKIGDVYTSNSGDVAVIVKYITSKKITVRFEDGAESETTQANLKRGSFKHPTRYKISVGSVYYSSDRTPVKVISYIDCTNILIEWPDGVQSKTRSKELKEGHFRHPTNWKIPVGKEFVLNSGEKVVVREFISATKIIVEFSDGVQVTTSKANLEKRGVAHPTRGVRIGEKFMTNCGWEGEVIGYGGAHDVLVKWPDGSTQTTSTFYVKNGSIKPATFKSVFGVGFPGIRLLKTDRESYEKSYRHWVAMIKRCYDEITQAQPKNWSYRGCTVDERWHDYSMFREWVTKQVGYDAACDHIDKDILVKGNKIYSPETCILLPGEINLAVSKGNKGVKASGLPDGVTKIDNGFVARCCTEKSREYLGFYKTPELAFAAYKRCKEDYIKRLAEKWKDYIDPRAHQALLAYTVEITD